MIKKNIVQEKQNYESQETICKTHNLEFVAVDLDIQDKSQITFLCGNCLLDKLNNNKIITISQSKERIQKMKVQQREIKVKENQTRLKYFQNILDQIIDFKLSIDNSLQKMCKQIQEYVFPIQKEKQELFEYQQPLSYLEDIKQFSDLYFQAPQKSSKLIEDKNFIAELTRQFELLFYNAEYFQSLDTFKNTKQTIQCIMQNNDIELPPLILTKQKLKTPSLSRVCQNHNKEIILIDMDTQNKKIENRFICVDCIDENPQIKYQTIENVNKQWKDYFSESHKTLQEYKKESQEKYDILLNYIAQMRKNYNKKLNEISEKLIEQQYQSIDRNKEYNQNNTISIQTLEDEQLLKDLKILVEKQKVTENIIITNFKNQDSFFKKEIENLFQSLVQYNQQDIQQSLDILREISIERNLIIKLSDTIQQFSKCAQQKDENYQDYFEIIKDIQELIDQTRKYQSQKNLFDQTIAFYQSHTNKINLILQKNTNQTRDQTQFQNLQNVLNDYIITLDNQSNQIKKYCNIQHLELELVKLTETNKHLEIDKTNLFNQMLKTLDQKHQDHYEALIKQKGENQFQTLEEKNKLEEEIQQNLKLQQIQQYQQGLFFSNTFKGVNCQVSEDGKVVECWNSYYLCLCEQVIPKTGKIKFAFQIVSLSSEIFVGIGFKDIIQKNNYQYEGIGNGSYLIRENGKAFSHHNSNVNAKYVSFTLTTNDIILIEVSIEHKYIKWTKQYDSQATIFEIETSKSDELYPCVYVYNSKVKILDKIPN